MRPHHSSHLTHTRPRRRRVGRGCMLLVMSAAVLSVGCGGYMSQSAKFRRAMTVGDTQGALKQVNEALGVDKPEQLPSKSKKNTPLLLLERGTILQALGRYDLSARDFQVADKNLDVLDLTKDTTGKIAKYLFSDSATVYKAPPYEKLLLNTVNMINYLARGDASGAKIEARRFLINRKFVQSTQEKKQKSMLALGSYLSGLAFQMAGESGPAMRHYADAHQAGGLPTLSNTIGKLNRETGATDTRVKTLYSPTQPTEGSVQPETGEIVVVVQAGMAPYKIPERLPIGAAIVAGSSPGPGARLNSRQRSRANRFAAKGILKWINYPRLRRAPYPPPYVEVAVDRRAISSGLALNVEMAAAREYKSIKGSLIAAAVVRMLTRAVAGGVSEAVGRRASKSGIAGFLIGLAVEGAMTAADTPDTRSWVTLPAKFYIARSQVPVGKHMVSLRFRGRTQTRQVDVKSGQINVLNFSALR